MSEGKVVRMSLQKDKEFFGGIPSYDYENRFAKLKLKPAHLKLEASWSSLDQEHKPRRDEIKLVQKAIGKLQEAKKLSLITVAYKMDRGDCFIASLSISPVFHAVLKEIVPEPIVRLIGKVEVSGNDEEGEGEEDVVIFRKDFSKDFKCSDEICTENETNGIQVCGNYVMDAEDYSVLDMTIAFSIELEWIRPPVISAKLSLNKIGNYLFENNASKDFTVVVENGNEIKCHGFMLGAFSPVFDRMVSDSGMKESISKRIVIEDVSEETFRMLLSYVYGQEVLFSSMDCHQFLKLLHVAHKYDVEGFEDRIQKALLEKDPDWFVPDVILEFYFLVQNVQELDELREELVLKMGRMSEKELRACDYIQTWSEEETTTLFDEIRKMRKEEEDEDETEEEDEDGTEEEYEDKTEEKDGAEEEDNEMEERGTKRKCEEES